MGQDFFAVLDQVLARLHSHGRVTYNALKLQFNLDDASLAVLKEGLLYTHPEVVDDAGRGLIRTGALASAPASTPLDALPMLPAAPVRPAPEAERRQLTVLFCDLVGSTRLAGQLDPEDLRTVVRAYQESAAEVIQPYEGHIAQHLGDGLLVYFGYPAAHEDDARRAVYTGLGIVQAIATLNTRLAAQYGVHLAVRLGIHTGVVVVGVMGAGGRHEHLALGETPNIAARLQSLAPANAVVISAVTARLVQGAFALEDLGTHTLHGVAEPMAVSRVRGLLATPSHDEEFLTAGAPVLVGREEESGLLRRRWDQSKAGLGQVVCISGEAGIGKSALVEGLRAQVRAEGSPRIAFRCSPYHTNSTLYPVITHIEHLLQFAPDDPPATRLTKLEAGLRPYGLPLAEVVQHIVAKTDGVPLYVEKLTKMLLASALLREEADQYVLTGPLRTVAIPDTLQDALMARLDQLNMAKEVAQLGAVLGREFAYELLQAIVPQDEDPLQAGLTQLVEAELLYQRGRPPRARYIFKHALIQDAAYASLLKSTRQQVHRQIAQMLEERFPETIETQPELVAQHYTEAGRYEQALSYWQRAGQRALQQSGNQEALRHLTTGLEMLATLPDTPARAQQDLDLQMLLGPALMATMGYGAPEVEHVYSRARWLCQQVGDTPQLFSVLRGLWQFSILRAELRTAYELAQQLFSLAQRLHDPILLPEAHRTLGEPLAWLGEFASARTHLEQGVVCYDPQDYHIHYAVGLNPDVTCHIFAALALWPLGYADQAQHNVQAALAAAQELSDPINLAFALCFAALFHQYRGEGTAAYERAEAAVRLATERGFAHFAALGTIYRGWALVMQDQAAEGIAQLQRGLMAYETTGALLERPSSLAQLAATYGQVGKVEEGLGMLDEALALVDRREIRWCEAELHRLKGQLLLALSADRHLEAEACFHQALHIAHRQEAKSLELRAAISLSRLWQQQGKQAEARELLAPVYGWFTEGFDTADLREARTLLDELT